MRSSTTGHGSVGEKRAEQDMVQGELGRKRRGVRVREETRRIGKRIGG